jgi:hypothetical protein
MSVLFVRQLGAESGVQLNPLQDLSALPPALAGDQGFAVAMRAARGRLDRAFLVDRGNAHRKLGRGESMRDNALNESYVVVREALNNGASRAVVARLHTESAALNWIVVSEIKDGDGHLTGEYAFTVSATEPTSGFVLAVKHLDCHNDGIQLAFRADEKRTGGAYVANDIITLRVYDADGELIEDVTGSLNPSALDDAGQSIHLPNVAAVRADSLQIVTGDVAEIPVASSAYGYATGERTKWARSETLVYFSEGGTAYTADDYQRAITALENTPHSFTYLTSAGSRAPILIDRLAQLSYRTNRPLKIDVPGDLDVDGAIAFVEQLNLSANAEAHLIQAFWAPLKSADPMGLNPRGFFGTATLNIALACSRNSRVDANGFAPKNYPIAGREWPVKRQLVEQTVFPSQQDLNALARARINPVVYEAYSDGGLYVFRDSLTMSPGDNSLKKLAAVADMATSIDDFVAKYGKDLLQLPMDVAVMRMEDALYRLFEGAQTAGWIVPSDEPDMEGAAYRYEVKPNAQRPYDVMDVRYWLRYVGTTRQIHVSQILVR